MNPIERGKAGKLSGFESYRESVVDIQGEAQGDPSDQHPRPPGRDQEDLDHGDPRGALQNSRQVQASQAAGSVGHQWGPHQVLDGFFAPTPLVLLLYAISAEIYVKC